MRNRQATTRPLVAVVVGAVVVVGMVGFSDYGTQQLVGRVTLLDQLTDEVLLGVTSSHLWLEEYLAGEEPEGRDRSRAGNLGGSVRIQAELDAARRSCATLWSGGLLDAAVVAALDAQAGQSSMNLCDRLDELHALTVERLTDPEVSGPGSAIDQRYDEVLFDVRTMAEDISAAVDNETAEQRQHLSVIAVVLATLVLAAFTLMGAFIHRATGRLERLSRRHGEILDAMPDGVLCVDAAGKIIFANTAAGALVARDATELLGLRAQEIISLDEAGDGGDDPSFAAVLRGEVEIHASGVTCRRANGSTFAAVCTTGATDASEATAGAVVVLRDVTKNRAIAVERDEMASIASATSDMAMIGLPDGRITWMNTAARALLGFAADEDITGTRIDDLQTAEEMARVSRDVMPVVLAESRWAGELTFQPRDGGQLPVSASLHAHTDGRGPPRYISAIMHDLRPRLAKEQELRDSGHRLAKAQRIARLGSFEMNLATQVVSWSDELHRIFGTDREVFEPRYDSFLAAVHHEDRVGVDTAVAEALAKNVEYAREFRIVRPDGGVRVLYARGVVVTDEEPDSARMVGTAQDVTELREVDRLKSEFVSVVSHELRTPLTSVHGALRLLQAGLFTTQPEQAQRMLDIAERNTDRLTRLINDIIDAERLASGKIDLQPQAVPVGDLTLTVVETLQATAEEAGVRLVVDTGPVVVWADPHRIEQVLINLLSNAIKFSPPGGTVRLSAQAVDGVAVLRVTDEGRGIPADLLEQVFERFQQVDRGDARDKGGTGLGLAICRGIVEQSGGRIWAENKSGSGATLVVTLPLEASAAHEVSTASPDTVLVCDDDEVGREAVADLLAARGYAVVQAGDGETAVELAVVHRPAVIVLDLLMPGLDGWQTAARLKAQPETCSIPIIILSVVQEGEADIEVGHVEAYVEKSSDPAQLLDAVDHAISSRPCLLLVEDDYDLARVLSVTFQQRGVDVVHAPTGAAALQLCEQLVPDVVVLDLGLPDVDGFTIVDWMRGRDQLGTVPLLVYTAANLSSEDHLRLAGGATSVLVKSSVSPVALERHVLALVDRITDRQAENN